MRKVQPHRQATRLTLLGALASWPLALASACSIYDDSLLGNAAAPLGGAAAGAGAGSGASSAGSGATGGAEANGATGGSASGSTAVAGKGGESPEQGGSAGSAAGGSAGTSAAGTSSAGTAGDANSGPTESIDDMEDGDAEIELSGLRNGYWYVGGDLTPNATTDPLSTKFLMTQLAAGERSTYVAHLKAVGFKDWGSVMGFNFIELLTKVKPYDGSAYCGIGFWGKSAAATTVRFRVPDIDTHQNGGVCVDGGTNGTACYDHFGASLSFSTAWKAFSLKFTDLAQVGTGYHPADGKLKADKLFAVEWALPGTGNTYEIWIDDVHFIKCE
ncbi:MAG TPA: carbohydrate binding domain-containing protein [Polyangiaceae bacterium]|nr:carbohydrate binding domain-containing protein [Polyangiaceae bacterium]